MLMKPLKVWAIVSPGGYMSAYGVARTRREAISGFLSFFDNEETRRREWRRMLKEGWTVARASVVLDATHPTNTGEEDTGHG